MDKEAGDESVVTINIKPADSGCRLTLVHAHSPEWAEYADRTKEGWVFMLEKLQKIVT